MISLHATKVLGIGEGAIVLSTDEAFIHSLRQVCNFGIWGSPEGQILGYNGKLSEYHAAVGLAALEDWPARRAIMERLTQCYCTEIAAISSISPVPNYGDGWISCYANVALNISAAKIMDRLTYMGIESRRWWRSGVHMERAYEAFPRDLLPVTERLAGRVVGLPFFHDITSSQISRVFACLRSALSGLA